MMCAPWTLKCFVIWVHIGAPSACKIGKAVLCCSCRLSVQQACQDIHTTCICIRLDSSRELRPHVDGWKSGTCCAIVVIALKLAVGRCDACSIRSDGDTWVLHHLQNTSSMHRYMCYIICTNGQMDHCYGQLECISSMDASIHTIPCIG